MFEGLGPALYVLRSLRDRTQLEVALAAGIPPSRLSKYENGREQPRLNTLAKLLEVLGTDGADFFYLVDFLETYAHPQPCLPPGSLRGDIGEAFSRVLSGLVRFHRVLLGHRVSAPGAAPAKRS